MVAGAASPGELPRSRRHGRQFGVQVSPGASRIGPDEAIGQRVGMSILRLASGRRREPTTFQPGLVRFVATGSAGE